jgi:hypothetical protein
MSSIEAKDYIKCQIECQCMGLGSWTFCQMRKGFSVFSGWSLAWLLSLGYQSGAEIWKGPGDMALRMNMSNELSGLAWSPRMIFHRKPGLESRASRVGPTHTIRNLKSHILCFTTLLFTNKYFSWSSKPFDLVQRFSITINSLRILNISACIEESVYSPFRQESLVKSILG